MRPDRAAELYFAARERRAQGLALLTYITDGLMLGLMDADDLAAVDEHFYRSRTEVINGVRQAYTDDAWNLRGFFDWEEAAVGRHIRSGSRVLVTGAGGGREVLALNGAGYDAYGLEPHPEFRRAGQDLLQRKGLDPGRLLEMRRDGRLAVGQRYDAVVVGWGSYMLLPSRARRVGLLRDLSSVLPAGGVVLLSFWPRSTQSLRRVRVVGTVAGAVRRVRRALPAEPGDLLDPNFVHVFTEQEIRREAEQAGFAMLEYRERPFGHAVLSLPERLS